MDDAPIHSVLLVDDFAPDVRYSALMLERSGRFRHVVTAASADEALRLLTDPEAATAHGDAWPPQAILLDINMPGLDGFELLEALARDAPAVTCPVVMLSSSLDERDRHRALSFAAVVDYACKPLSVEVAHALADRLQGRTHASVDVRPT